MVSHRDEFHEGVRPAEGDVHGPPGIEMIADQRGDVRSRQWMVNATTRAPSGRHRRATAAVLDLDIDMSRPLVIRSAITRPSPQEVAR